MATFLLILAVLGGLGATLWQARATEIAAAESEATADFLARLLGSADPLAPERRDTLRVVDLLDEGALRVRDELAAQPRVQARLFHVLGRTYRGVERWADSDTLLRQSLGLYRSLGEPLVPTALVLGDLARTQSSLGDHEAAIAFAEEARALAVRSGDPEAEIDAAWALGGVTARAANKPYADSLLTVALGQARAHYGPGHLTVAQIESELGLAYLDRGELDKATEHLQAGLDAAIAATSADHPMLVASYQNLAFTYQFAGEYEKAERASARGVEIARAQAGGEARLGQVLSSHAQALRRLGRLDEAEAALREAIPLVDRREVDRAIPLGTLASVLDERGDLPGAVDAQRRSRALLVEHRGEASAVAQSSTVKLAGLLVKARQFAEAERLLLGLPSLEDEGGPPSPHARMLQRQVGTALADLYDAWGRPALAARHRPEPMPGRHGG